ncbi:hypothetical protein S7711_07165 [Stachybotrys chartarum IBT 7711]|uniref:VOC domain-containing protein n=1 Tax=Stachybotrys chartarum (strain CBS 109288 / IBT 7711) TaxID=1280523 RepID=A0A084BAI3_STACB|nr:hypothetical protein S7711_07165 [Stachybotrys chartarum IBT 7711]KFA51560.1 hypothetical protein S40293_03959 [Stachybotrys chartarum IBT 40293]KFA72236.1 hypothetical protein S40288_07391 [Stachybotrys chartarum IBT 40288]
MASNLVPPPVQIAHVVLRTTVENYPAMVRFYRTFLGGSVSAQVPGMSFITFDNEHHRVAVLAVPDAKPKDPATCGLEHISFTHANLDDLLLAYRSRKAMGLNPVWCVNHGPTLSIYYKDPDGNNLETQIDTLKNIDEINEMITGDEFRENPVGVDFDPEELWKKMRSGVPYEELVTRRSIGPRSFDTVPL